MSNEVLIVFGDGREDPQLFEELGSPLREDLAPVGAVEEVLVERIIAVVWRSRRALRYETAAIRNQADTVVTDWKAKDREKRLSLLASEQGNLCEFMYTDLEESLLSQAKALKEDLRAWRTGDPLRGSPTLWRRAFAVAEEDAGVAIGDLLGLEAPWRDDKRFSPDQVHQVIKAACQDGFESEKEFWEVVKVAIQFDYDDVIRRLEAYRWTIERLLGLAGLPDERSMEKVCRYETHLWREFYKALHELQRLQAARKGLRITAPVALDIQIDSGRLEKRV